MSNTIKEGNMVQVWDWQDGGTDAGLTSHGRVGYVVKKEQNLGQEGNLWKIVFFDGDGTAFSQVHEDWLNVINSAADIRETE